MPSMKIFVDTNILLNEKFVFADYQTIYISITTIEELDNQKTHERLGYFARQAIRNIKDADNVKKVLDYKFEGANRFLQHGNDNHILAMAYETWYKDPEVTLLCDDYGLTVKADALGIPCELFEYKEDENYKGYQELSGDTNFINNLFEDISKGKNDYGFVVNEYLTLRNTDLKTKPVDYRFDGKEFVALKLPDSKVIKGMNNQQRFALDLLGNKDIPIKVIAGGFGSGKTILSVKVGLDQVTSKEIYKTLMFVRNPLPADGTDIGFLPGSKDEKIYDYCRPFLQYIEDPNNQFYAENLIRNEKIKMDVVSFLKGISIDDSYVIMDEAEDLNTKLIKLVGSRIGDTSTIVFTGDWKQAENRYKYDNGLLKVIKKGKGNPLVGIVVLEDDVRSPASRFFADL